MDEWLSGNLETQELKVFAQIVKLKNVPWLIFIEKNQRLYCPGV